MKRITVPNKFWREKVGFFNTGGGTLGLIYDKTNLACPLMLFNATVPLYEAINQPETIEEVSNWYETRIRELQDRIFMLEEKLLTKK